MDWLKRSSLCLLLFASEVKAEELGIKLLSDSNISFSVFSVRNATYLDFSAGVIFNEVDNGIVDETEVDIQFLAGLGTRLLLNDYLLRIYGEIHQGIAKTDFYQVNKDLYVAGINMRKPIGNKNFDLYLQKNFSRTKDFNDSYSIGIGMSFTVE